MHEVAPLGRDADLAAIAGLIEEAAEGRGGALVLAAGPGEGRTTMLRAAAGAVANGLVVPVPGHADEAEVAYGGLERLIELLIESPAGSVRDLPAEWREPLLAVAAGRDPGTGPLPLCLAVVALLRRAARERAVLCLFDDADLLDGPTWQVIRLVARRVAGVSVALLATVTASAAGHAAAAGLPMRQLRSLSEESCRELLRRRAPGITDDVAAGLLDIAHANPAALVDLATALTPEQRRGYAALPATLPPDSGLRRRLRDELASLPLRTRTLLLLAATEPGARPAELLAAAERMAGEAQGVRLSDLDLADRAGLVTVGEDGVRFTPAVARSVVFEEEPLGRRHAAHLALAGVFGGGGRRLPALVHLAAVEVGPDEELARELLAAAEGAPPIAAAVAQRRAAELSAAPGAAAAALLAAARSLMAAGRTHEAGLLVRRAGKLRGSASVRARARGALAEINLRSAPGAAQEVLLDVAAELLPADPRGALDALLLAGDACSRTGEPGRYPELARQAAARFADERSKAGRELVTARAAADARGPAPVVRDLDAARHQLTAKHQAMTLDEARAVDLAMALHHVAGVADLMTGADEAAFGHLREVLRLAERTADPAGLIRAANTGIVLGQDKRAARLAGRAAGLARESGAHALVPAALEVAAFADLAAGRYDHATASALDGAAVARGAGRPDLADTHLALLGLLAAFVGDRESAAERLAATRHADAEVRGLGDWAEALLDLVAGRQAAAAERLAGVFAGGSLILRVAITPHLLEASAHLGPETTAPEGTSVFDQWAGRTRQSGWLALRSRCRALTAADHDAAEDHFREALGWHGRDDDPGFARAHTELLYGRHLRRRRRPAEARDHLRRAVDTFHRLDAGPWAEQAMRELRAAGAKVDPVGRTPLTAQQERIAGLVAEGATNREVARQLHLSPRTIDHHLRNVFARLGVRSRTELARLLAG
ncbi:LuxR C-terminal-related transcriptional regulator [Actinoplanes sp. NPDC000266]